MGAVEKNAGERLDFGEQADYFIWRSLGKMLFREARYMIELTVKLRAYRGGGEILNYSKDSQ